MMNSHIAIFFAGTENAGSAIAGECPRIVRSAWLTLPPTSIGLEFHPKQQQQIQPQCTHEMPVARSSVQSASPQVGCVQFSNHAGHTAKAAKQMHGMSNGQHIEEGVADVGRKL